MRFRPFHSLKLAEKYRGEIFFSTVSAILGVIFGVVVRSLVLTATVIDLIIAGLLFGSIVFTIGLATSIKRNLTWKVREMESVVTEIYGRPRLPTPYVSRLSHFAVEKELLAKELVRHRLPALIDRCRKRDAAIRKIAVVIDSGTTLTPIFPKLKYYGYGRVSKEIAENIAIYTNSLSGTIAFNQESGFEPYKIRETDLHLLGGNPLEKYRATTGPETQEALRNLHQKYSANDCLIVGIITANWLLVTEVYNRVFICARGRGHYEFKEKLVEISNKIIIVAPLGKILKLDSVEELNEVLEEDEEERYRGFEIAPGRRSDTFLLTTRRARRDSILYRHSQNLDFASQKRDTTEHNFTLLEKLPACDPKLPPDQQIEIEVPHHYLRRHIGRVFG